MFAVQIKQTIPCNLKVLHCNPMPDIEFGWMKCRNQRHVINTSVFCHFAQPKRKQKQKQIKILSNAHKMDVYIKYSFASDEKVFLWLRVFYPFSYQINWMHFGARCKNWQMIHLADSIAEKSGRKQEHCKQQIQNQNQNQICFVVNSFKECKFQEGH